MIQEHITRRPSSISRKPVSDSRRPTCHTPSVQCAGPLDPVRITGIKPARIRDRRSISITGIPTPVASATTVHRPSISGRRTTRATSSTTVVYMVPSGSRRSSSARHTVRIGCTHLW